MATKRANREYEELVHFARNFQAVQFLPTPTITPVYTGSFPEDDDEQSSTSFVNQYNPLEPKNLGEFIGQEQAKDIVRIIVDAANKEKRLIPNILLTGAYGHGKTTLSKLITKRHKKKPQVIDGSVAGLLVKPSKDTIYVIDEAHNIPPAVMDTFNILMDAGELRIIACTTNPGKLSAPFRSRFRSIYLEEYQPKDIAKIVEKASKRLGVDIDKVSVNEIANRSKCNPRNSLAILDFVREVSIMSKEETLSTELVTQALDKLGIDSIGLTNMDKKYLELLNTERPTGLQYISAALSIDIETVQQEIEPYLLRIGLIERTPRGRILVDAAHKPIHITDSDRDSLLTEQLKRSLEML